MKSHVTSIENKNLSHHVNIESTKVNQPIDDIQTQRKVKRQRSERKKKVSRNMNKRKYKSRKINRNSTQQLRYQSRSSQALVLKRRRRQQMLLKKKKKLLKQHMASKKKSTFKVNKNKSFTLSQHARKINTTNSGVTSTISPRRSSTSKLTRTRSVTKSKQIRQQKSGGTKLNIRLPPHTTLKKYVRDCRTRRSIRRKIKFLRCTSKTLITIAPMNANNENLIKSMDINNDNTHTKTSSSLVSLKNSLSKKQLSTSTVMPLTKTSAQLMSKNNNRCILKMKRQGSSLISRILEGNLKVSTRRGMTLRSRTIMINNDNLTERKERKYKRNHGI